MVLGYTLRGEHSEHGDRGELIFRNKITACCRLTDAGPVAGAAEKIAGKAW
jgi:hypothetical protein